jgi:hypothetical protein
MHIKTGHNRPLRCDAEVTLTDLLPIDIPTSSSYTSAGSFVYRSRDRMINTNSSSKIL